MKLIDATFPLLVMVSGDKADDAEIRAMDEQFRKLYARGERYVLITVPPKNAGAMAAKERKMIADWASQPHVHEGTKRCCAGSAVVVTSAMGRGALTAILWVWRPPVHLEIVSDVKTGIDYCVNVAQKAGLRLPYPAEQIHSTLTRLLDEADALSA